MLKKEITYVDYDGNERTETFYFNLSKAETIQWLTTSGDYTLDKVFLKLAAEKNGKEVMKIFENLIYMSYGEKSLDGRRFIKSEEVKRNFMETEAYSVLFTELVTDAKRASDFMKAILPNDMGSDINRILEENKDGLPAEIRDYVDILK